MRDDEVILITGASSDIGRELIRQLTSTNNGHEAFRGKLIAHAYSGMEKLAVLKQEMPCLDKQIEIIRADLSLESDLCRMIAAIRERHGFPTQIVHLAAARVELKRVTEFDWNWLAKDLEIQLRSISMILQEFLPDMTKSHQRCKVILMLSSVTLGAPQKYMTQYTIVKYALLGLLRSLAVEYADKPICFNAVSPSMVDTQFLTNIPEKYIEMTAAAHPSKRNATVMDVVPALLFLLAHDSDYISGANLPVTAGSII